MFFNICCDFNCCFASALYAFSYNNAPEKSRVKVLILIGVVVLISTILCTICADVLNVYAMPISLCAVLLCLLVNMKVALAGNVVLSQILLIVFMIKTRRGAREPFTAVLEYGIYVGVPPMTSYADRFYFLGYPTQDGTEKGGMFGLELCFAMAA